MDGMQQNSTSNNQNVRAVDLKGSDWFIKHGDLSVVVASAEASLELAIHFAETELHDDLENYPEARSRLNTLLESLWGTQKMLRDANN